MLMIGHIPTYGKIFLCEPPDFYSV